MGPAAITSVAFDYSGQYLAAAGGGGDGCGLRVFSVIKGLSDLMTLPEAHTKTVSGIAWGPDASFLASCGHDRAVKLWSPSGSE